MAQGWLRAKIYDCYGGAAGEWRNVIAARSPGEEGRRRRRRTDEG